MGEGGVRVDGERVIDLERVLGRGSQVVLQLGRRFKRVLVK